MLLCMIEEAKEYNLVSYETFEELFISLDDEEGNK